MTNWSDERQSELNRVLVAAERVSAVTNRYDDLVKTFRDQLQASVERSNITHLGFQLWDKAVADIQSGNLDDRPLYWARLKIINLLAEAELDDYIQDFDYASRGLLLRPGTPAHNIVLTGFDPFHLDQKISQSNPSGLIALALNGQFSSKISIQTAIFPVRFLDFGQDAIVETYLSEVVSPSTKLVVTCSMGRNQFDIERFVIGRRTSSAPDNCNLIRSDERIAVIDSPQEDPSAEPNFYEFLESSLPTTPFSKSSRFGPWKTKFNAEIETRERGVFEASALEDLQNQTAKQGSGGGFLSNEISYRSLLWQKRHGTSIPMGHIHVPRMEGYDPVVIVQILDQFRAVFGALAQELDLVNPNL